MSNDDTQNGIGIHNEMREWRAHMSAESQHDQATEVIIDNALLLALEQFGIDPANWLHGFAKNVSLKHKKEMLDAIADAVTSARRLLDRRLVVQRTQLPPLDITYAAHLIGFEPTGDSQ